MAKINSGELSATDATAGGPELLSGAALTFQAEWVYATRASGGATPWTRYGDDLLIVVKDGDTVVYWQSVGQVLGDPSGTGDKKTTANFSIPSNLLLDGKTYTIEYYRQDSGSTASGTMAPDLNGWTADGMSTFKVDASVSQNILTNPLDPSTPEVDYLVNDTSKLTGQTEAGATSVVISIVVGGTTRTATVTNQGGNPALKADGSWSYTIPSNWGLVDGTPYTATIVATDAAGNTRTDSFLLSVDTTPPEPPSVNEFTFTTPDSKWKHDIGALGIVGDVSGTAEPSSEIRIYTLNGQKKENNQTVIADANGKWTWTPKLDLVTDDDNTADTTISLDMLYSPINFVLDSIDAAGNVSKTVQVLLGANAVKLGDNPDTDGIEADFVLNNINDGLTGTINDDLIIGYAGDDFLNGRAGNDFLYGGSGRDWLVGGEGNDELAGGTQADLLDGGGGADRFIYSRFNESSLSERDQIINFSGTELDVIDVSELCRALGITGSFKAAYTFGASGTDATTTKVKGKTVTTGSTAAKGEFWLGDDGVLYGNLDDRTGAEFAVALVTPTLDAENNVIGYTPITNVAGMRTYLAGAGLDFSV